MTDPETADLQAFLTEELRKTLDSFVGSTFVNEGGLAAIEAAMNRRLSDLDMRRLLPPQGAWEMLKIMFASDGWRLDEAGKVWGNDGTEDYLCGTVDKTTVKFGAGATAHGDTILVNLVEYDYTPEPTSMITVTVNLSSSPVRNTAENPVDEEEFKRLHGYPPRNDDLKRTNCQEAGDLGHWACGLCPEHNKARFACGCVERK